jgi:hypothetical protein
LPTKKQIFFKKVALSSLRSQLIGMMECWNSGMLDKRAIPIVPFNIVDRQIKWGLGLELSTLKMIYLILQRGKIEK